MAKKKNEAAVALAKRRAMKLGKKGLSEHGANMARAKWAGMDEGARSAAVAAANEGRRRAAEKRRKAKSDTLSTAETG